MSARHRLTRRNRSTAYRPGTNTSDAAVFLSEIRAVPVIPIGQIAAGDTTASVPAGVALVPLGDHAGRIPAELHADAVGVELSRDSDPNIRRI